MQAEAEQEEAQRLQLAYPLPAVREGRGLTAEQREARRRLCRLWTSANHAVMHGFCLMSLQLMTGREVLRTHIFWRIMMKRVLWGVFEEMRRNAEKLADSFELQTTAAVEDIELPQVGTQAADTRATSFYEDYLHRGIAEPLASMNLYVYAMQVLCRYRKPASLIMVSLIFRSSMSKRRRMCRFFMRLPAFLICMEYRCPKNRKIRTCGLLCTLPYFESIAVKMRRFAVRRALFAIFISSLESRVCVWCLLATMLV